MANDRLFLQCRACGAELMLGKYRPGSGFCLAALCGDPSVGAWISDHGDMDHVMEHDAFDRAEDRPFALYREDGQAIPRWDRSKPEPPKPDLGPSWGTCAVCGKDTPDATGDAVYSAGRRFHVPCWLAYQAAKGEIILPTPTE